MTTLKVVVDTGRNEFQPAPGESLLWVGYPTRAPVVFGGRDLLRVPFSFAFAGIVVTGVVRAWISGAPGPGLTMAPLVLAALYFAVGRFFLNWHLRLRTTYFLTTNRVVIRRRSFGRERTVERAIGDVTLVEHDIGRDGSGTIRFDPEPGRLGLLPRRRLSDWHDAGLHGLQFFRIPDAAAVVELLETSTTFLDRTEPQEHP